ncbi:MAG: hypothetical protein WBN88_15700 [Anderseniella sp.]
MAKLPITPDTIDGEIETAVLILNGLRKRLTSIPVVDKPASEEQFIDFVRELCGELMVAGNKCSSLSAILADLTV